MLNIDLDRVISLANWSMMSVTFWVICLLMVPWPLMF